MRLVFIGLSITSSWGNGHATTYRALLKALAARGHSITFLERDVPWYAQNRDLPAPDFAHVHLYRDLAELRRSYARLVAGADAVVVGSFVPDGVAVGSWVCATAKGLRAFYDIDTPVTLAKLERGDDEYLSTSLLQRFDLYLSFAGGPCLDTLELEYGARLARPLYCSVDPEVYRPLPSPSPRYTLGYLGTYSVDRQPKLDELLLRPAHLRSDLRFVVGGPQYPAGIVWPHNVERVEHVPPAAHRAFYGGQAFTLNLTRDDMVTAGWSPSVRLFEAAACGVPILSDRWPGIEQFFEPDDEIVLVDDAMDVLRALRGIGPERRQAIGQAARARVLRFHTAAVRARQLELYLAEARLAPAHAPLRKIAGAALSI